MKTVMIALNSISDVQTFVNIVSKCDFDIDLTSGRYVVDAKSIMGIFSLDLSKPIQLDAHFTDGFKDGEEFMKELEPFIVK